MLRSEGTAGSGQSLLLTERRVCSAVMRRVPMPTPEKRSQTDSSIGQGGKHRTMRPETAEGNETRGMQVW